MDKTTAEWFDVAQVEVVIASPELEGWLPPEDLARLSGAPKGSRLTVRTTDDGLIELKVENYELLAEPMIRLIIQEADGFAFYILNAVFVLHGHYLGQGIGTRSVSLEIQQAKDLGLFTKIRTFAVGNWASFNAEPPLRGYYAWPLMGFDAPLPAELLKHPDLPGELRGSTTLLELMGSESGEQFWLEFGQSVHVEFNLEDGSDSWKRHWRYTEERGIQVKP